MNQTWIQMKIDFRKALKELKKTGGIQVKNMHANLVQEIVNGIQEVIQPTLENAGLPSLQETDATDESSLASTLQMNAIMTDPTMVAMQQQIAQLNQLVTQMATNQPQQQFQGHQQQQQFQIQQQSFQVQQQHQGRPWGGRCGRGRGYKHGCGTGRGRWQQQQQPMFQQSTTFQQNNPFFPECSSKFIPEITAL